MGDAFSVPFILSCGIPTVRFFGSLLRERERERERERDTSNDFADIFHVLNT